MGKQSILHNLFEKVTQIFVVHLKVMLSKLSGYAMRYTQHIVMTI